MRLLIFGGTTEGRLLSGFCNDNKIPTDVCVTTDYGAELLKEFTGLNVYVGKKDLFEIKSLLATGYDYVIDATHPFAVEATRNIRGACEEVMDRVMEAAPEETTNHKTGDPKGSTRYLRLVRPLEGPGYGIGFKTLDDMVDFINNHLPSDKRILVATGSKELRALTEVVGFADRLVPRFLPDEKAKLDAIKMGYREDFFIMEKGPFSVPDNIKHFKDFDISVMITKDSGKTGGFPEKIEAAEAMEVLPLVLERPVEEGLTLEEMKAFILEKL